MMHHGARKCLTAIVWLALCAGCISPQSADKSPLAATTPAGSNPAAQGGATAYPGQQSSFESTSPPPYTAIGNPELLAEDDDENRTLGERLQDMSIKKSYAKFLDSIGLGPDMEIARTAYSQGEEAFRAGRYDEAAARFKRAARRWPDSTLEEDALFMQAESYFFADRYSKCSDTYTNLMKKYEYSRHMDKIMQRRFAIGRYWDDRGRDRAAMHFNVTDRTIPFWDVYGNSIAVYDSIRLDDPTGPLADDSTMASANAYFLRENYEEAAYHYDLVRKQFPQSEHQPEAHLLGMRSHMLAYQGPSYDGKPLNEAKLIGEQLETQFSGELPEHRDQIKQARRDLEEQAAERDWTMAEYYAGNRHYRAARRYYNFVIEKHPNTRYAEMSRQRLDEHRDKPDEPINHFEWLTAPLTKSDD